MSEINIVFPHVSNMIWDKRIFEFKPAVVGELMNSFKEVGQLQPIVVIAPEEGESGPYKLVIGRHRYQAAKELYKQDPTYTHKFLGRPAPEGCVAAIDVRDIPPEMLLNMELAENLFRMNLSWQERAAALASFHEVEMARFNKQKQLGIIPETQTYTMSDTAKKLVGVTGGNEDAARTKVSQALIVAARLDDPEVAKAESPKAAFNIIRHKLTVEARKLATDYTGDTPHILHHADCKDLMAEWVDAGNQPSFKLLLADPPYGIGAHTYDNMRHHKYLDTWENAEETYAAICELGHDLCADNASMFLFCSPENWHKVQKIAMDFEWKVWFRPIVWIKSNEGMRPLGQRGFAYTYETIMWAWKGEGLVQTHNDVFTYYKPAPSQREHAAAKPVSLYEKLIQLTCLPGDWVLDPCVGSGTSFKAGYLQKVRVVGIEKEEEPYAIAKKNLFWTGAEEVTANNPAAPGIDDI